MKFVYLPFPVFMVLLAVAIGLAGGLGNSEMITVLIRGFGNNLGYFCVLLLGSFFLAAHLDQGKNLRAGTMVAMLNDTDAPLTLVFGLFVVAAVFKVVNGSSMATFAALPPIPGPLLSNAGTDLIVAVYAICLGSFIAILPNASFYWLVRNDAFAGAAKAVNAFTGASVCQAITGLIVLCVMITLFPS